MYVERMTGKFILCEHTCALRGLHFNHILSRSVFGGEQRSFEAGHQKSNCLILVNVRYVSGTIKSICQGQGRHYVGDATPLEIFKLPSIGTILRSVGEKNATFLWDLFTLSE